MHAQHAPPPKQNRVRARPAADRASPRECRRTSTGARHGRLGGASRGPTPLTEIRIRRLGGVCGEASRLTGPEAPLPKSRFGKLAEEAERRAGRTDILADVGDRRASLRTCSCGKKTCTHSRKAESQPARGAAPLMLVPPKKHAQPSPWWYLSRSLHSS